MEVTLGDLIIFIASYLYHLYFENDQAEFVNVTLAGHENKCKPLQYEGTFTFGRISNKKGFVFAHSIL